jgi:hypothetical protein
VTRWSLVAALVLGVVGYAVGRYIQPARVETVTKVETKTQIEYRDKIVEHRVEGPVRTVTRTLTRELPCIPGDTAPFTDTTTTVEEGPVVTDSTTDSTGTIAQTTRVESKTVTVYTRPRLMLQGGMDLSRTWSLGGGVRAIGPVWLGVEYRNELSRPTLDRFALKLSLTF